MIRTLLKIFAPITIFLGTIALLFMVWDRFALQGSRDGRQKHVTILKEGNADLYPEIADYFYPPGSVIKVIKKKNGKILTENTYSLNKWGLRDKEALPAKRKSHLIFTGCSFTFGEGLDDKDTFASQVSYLFPEMNVRNISFLGGGVQTSLRFMELVRLREFAPEEDGIMAYVFISDHLNRFLDRPAYLDWAKSSFPRYERRNGEITYAGKVSVFPGQRQYLKFLNRGKGDEFTDEELNFFADAVDLQRNRYLRLYPKGRFVVINHGIGGVQDELLERLRHSFDTKKIEFIDVNPDYHSMIKTSGISPDSQFLADGHPSAIHNRFFTKWLVEKIVRTDAQNPKSRPSQ